MDLRYPLSHPPTQREMGLMHELHREATLSKEAGSPVSAARVSEHVHAMSVVVYPEKRNVHGKLFGGFIASTMFDLAFFAVSSYTRGRPFVPIGLDEVIFHQPVAIGDLLRCEAVVVHESERLCRVMVKVNVLDATNPTQAHKRTNKAMFVFALDEEHDTVLLPDGYGELLMHVHAARRHSVEGLITTQAQADMDTHFFKEHR